MIYLSLKVVIAFGLLMSFLRQAAIKGQLYKKMIKEKRGGKDRSTYSSRGKLLSLSLSISQAKSKGNGGQCTQTENNER